MLVIIYIYVHARITFFLIYAQPWLKLRNSCIRILHFTLTKITFPKVDLLTVIATTSHFTF